MRTWHENQGENILKVFFTSLLYAVCFLLLGENLYAISLPQQPLKKAPFIFEVRKSLSLQSQNTIETDYYVNAGRSSGLIPGMIITVRRKFEFQNLSEKSELMFQKLWLPVGDVRVFYSESTISVVRVHKIYSEQAYPLLFYNAIMIGDKLDMNSLRFLKNVIVTEEKRPEKEKKEAIKEVALKLLGKKSYSSSISNSSKKLHSSSEKTSEFSSLPDSLLTNLSNSPIEEDIKAN